ncbi:neuropeptide receptor-like protein 4, partial [Aphelenchoides avenae]
MPDMTVTEANPDESIAVLILRSLVGCLSILSNLLIIAIFLRFPKFRLSHTNGLITLLALSGLVVGMGLIARAVASQVMSGAKSYDRVVCISIGLPQFLGMFFTQTTLLAIAMDRYSAIRRPCRYSHHVVK